MSESEIHVESPLIERDLGPEPEDKYNLVWIIFCILGVGILFPWNAFLSAYDYFHAEYPKYPIQFALSLAFNYPSIVLLFISVKFGPKLSFGGRIIFGFLIDLLILCAVPVLVPNFSRELSFRLLLVLVFVTGGAGAILSGGVMGLAAIFPPKYIGAVMSGNGVAGIISILIRIITKVSLKGTPRDNALSADIYFGLAGLTMLICIVAYIALTRVPYSKYYITNFENQKQKKDQYGVNDKNNVTMSEVFKKIYLQSFNVLFTFFVTLSLFPGVISLIPSQNNSDWFQIFQLLIFMIGDYIGRTLPRWVNLFKPTVLWIPVVIRLVFFALFVLCVKPRIFAADYAAYIIMAVFSVTNGYCGTFSMMYGPMSVEPHEREVAGTMMSFFLNLGIFLGINFALVMLYALTGSFGLNQ